MAREVRSTQRYDRNNDQVCPVCTGAADDPSGEGIRCYGYITSKGRSAVCMRVESPNQARSEGGYIHTLDKLKLCACGKTHPRPSWWQTKPVTYEIKNVLGVTIAIHERTDHWNSGDKTMRWAMYDRSLSLPLYGTELLPNLEPGADIIVTEGEKATLAL